MHQPRAATKRLHDNSPRGIGAFRYAPCTVRGSTKFDEIRRSKWEKSIMCQTPCVKRWLAAGGAIAIIGVVLFFALPRAPEAQPTIQAAQALAAKAGDWTMFGGTPSRNFINPVAKGIPTDWDFEKKENILWVADLGSKAYGGPVVAGGRIFVGTNNLKPRNPKDVDANGVPLDLGVLMCFD